MRLKVNGDLSHCEKDRKKNKQICAWKRGGKRRELQLRKRLALRVLWAFTPDTYLKGLGLRCLATVRRGKKGNSSRSRYCRCVWVTDPQLSHTHTLNTQSHLHKSVTWADLAHRSPTPFLISLIFSLSSKSLNITSSAWLRWVLISYRIQEVKPPSHQM